MYITVVPGRLRWYRCVHYSIPRQAQVVQDKYIIVVTGRLRWCKVSTLK